MTVTDSDSESCRVFQVSATYYMLSHRGTPLAFGPGGRHTTTDPLRQRACGCRLALQHQFGLWGPMATPISSSTPE